MDGILLGFFLFPQTNGIYDCRETGDLYIDLGERLTFGKSIKTEGNGRRSYYRAVHGLLGASRETDAEESS